MLTLHEVLQLPVLARGQPQLLHGAEVLDRNVRWVHTSEIAGIAPLLKGGEILLTTGLGLSGATPGEQRRYVEELADRQVAALFLELGRTFPTVPGAVLDAARDRDLVLVALHGVVPFVEVTEAVHALLLSRRLDDLSRADAITQALNEVLLGGGGLVPLLTRAAELAGAPARVTGPDGRVVATSDTSFGEQVPLRPRPRAAVRVFGRGWGHVEFDLSPDTAARLLLERVAVAVGIELLRSGDTANPQLLARYALLDDLARGRAATGPEARARAELVGIDPPAGNPLRGLVVQLSDVGEARASQIAATTAARPWFQWASVAIGDGGQALAIVAPRGEDVRGELQAFVDTWDEELSRGGTRGVLAAAAGPLVTELEGVGRSLQAAREACQLSVQLALGRRVLLSTDVSTYRLLKEAGEDTLQQLVDEQLGRLLEYDASHSSELVRTVETYVRSGASKTLAAERLGLRRQSLYHRLERIEEVLGDTLDHDRLLGLELALLAWRLRSAGGVGQARRAPT